MTDSSAQNAPGARTEAEHRQPWSSENVGSVCTLDGTVRHLLDPDVEQAEAPSSFGSTLVTACRRSYFVVWDPQHSRPLCRRCRTWLRLAYEEGRVTRDR